MPSLLSRSLPARLVVVLAAGLLAAGGLSASALADTPSAALGRVGGLVLDRSNQPLVGATITLTDALGAAAGSSNTRDQGRWSLAVPQGDYDLEVTAQQDGHTLAAKVRHYTVGADTKLNLVLAGDPAAGGVRAASAADGSPEADGSTFTRAAAAVTPSSSGMVTFSGEVLDADGHPVVSGINIWLNQPQTYFYRDVTVADDGSFSLEVPAGSYYLGVATGVAENDCPGCAYERTPQREHDYTVENFQLDGDRQETIHLPRPSVLPVTVVDPAGRPVAGAWVRDLTSGQQPTIQDLLFPGTVTDVFTFVDQLTGTDGTVQLEFIAGAAPATISVDPPPGTTLPSLTAFPPHATSVTIRLQDGPTLQGRLLGANDGAFGVSEAYLVDDSGTQYPFAVSNGRYAVTAPAGRYRITMQEAHNEEGESSDYQVWSLQSSPFQLEGDRTLDLTVPLGYARLWVVNDDGQPTNDLGDGPQTTSSPFTIADGIDATAMTDLYGTGYASSNFPVIGPSTTSDLELDGASFPAGVRVAPGEDTIIAFILGTGPGYDHTPTTTTTTTTAQPTVTTTTGESGTATSSDPPVGTGSQLPGPTTRTGYWALGSDGHIYNFGDAPALGNAAIGAIDLEPTPTGKGYWTLNRNGTVQAFGDAAKLGEADTTKLAEGEEPASLSATPTGKGYWIFTNRGRVLAFGDAQFLGDMSQTKLNGPVLGSVATPSGKGYYMVASDGGIFAFGDATFAGSMGGKKLNAPVQSLVPDADGSGYWLVASDGGVFAFSAPFRGAMGGTRLNKPVSGMVRYGDGYLMVGADGGIFNFSTSPFSGSLGDKPPTAPVVAVAALPSI